MPVRIQRKRTKGWKWPEGAVYVGRPSQWGNPWKVNHAFCGCGSEGVCLHTSMRCHTPAAAVEAFRRDIEEDLISSKTYIRRELNGKDLACWCPLDRPCHADVLLEIANAPIKTTEEV